MYFNLSYQPRARNKTQITCLALDSRLGGHRDQYIEEPRFPNTNGQAHIAAPEDYEDDVEVMQGELIEQTR